MSKKNKRKAGKKRSNNKGIVIALVIVILLLIAAVAWLIMLETGSEKPSDSDRAEETLQETVSDTENVTSEIAATETANVETEQVSPGDTELEAVDLVNMDLGQGLILTDIGSYVGIYMEDGSDEVVSDILMIVVKNTGDLPLQYAEIELTANDVTASFTVSTLPAGESAVLLEQNRMLYNKELSFSQASAKHIAFFSEPLSLCEDKLKVQGLDGVLNIINVSDEDITGDIELYYKNASQDIYYGGITYRVRISGGLAAGQVKQIVSEHFSDSGSKIMFVKCS